MIRVPLPVLLVLSLLLSGCGSFDQQLYDADRSARASIGDEFLVLVRAHAVKDDDEAKDLERAPSVLRSLADRPETDAGDAQFLLVAAAAIERANGTGYYTPDEVESREDSVFAWDAMVDEIAEHLELKRRDPPAADGAPEGDH